MDVASRAGLLRETGEHHGPYENTHAPHDWWDWYAPIWTREHGRTPEEASQTAGRYMDEVLHVAALWVHLSAARSSSWTRSTSRPTPAWPST